MATEQVFSCPSNSKFSDQDFNLISQARDEFDKALYDSCLQTLAQLETSLGRNLKIDHNRAIIEFYKSNCKDYDVLLSNLEKLSPNEPDDTKPKQVTGKDIVLSPIAIYNKCVIYFCKRKFYMAIDTLSPVLEKFDELDELTSVIVGVLMLNLLLETNQINRAQTFLEVLYNQFGICVETSASEGTFPPDIIVGNEELSYQIKLMSILTNIVCKKFVAVLDDDSLEISSMKAHQFYMMKDFQMASKHLKKISESFYPQRSCSDLDTCIANNMGVIHLRVRHYAIAANFLQNAINFDKSIITNLSEAPLKQLGAVHTQEISYNMGISMLHLRRPKEAFQCLFILIKTYHSNPRLWFRLAETCIMDYEMKMTDGEKIQTIITGLSSWGKKKKNTVTPEPSLQFAVLCLRNALTLATFFKSQLTTYTNECMSDGKQNWSKVKDSNFCNPSMIISLESLDNLLSAIYAAYSYVSLRIGDYMTAYELAQQLIKIENLSDAHKMLAHMYAGEALIMMDRLTDARPHLEPPFISNLNAYDFETKNWKIKSLDAAQTIVRYNLAVAFLLQGDYELAIQTLHLCTHPIVASKVIGLKPYLNAVASQVLTK